MSDNVVRLRKSEVECILERVKDKKSVLVLFASSKDDDFEVAMTSDFMLFDAIGLLFLAATKLSILGSEDEPC